MTPRAARSSRRDEWIASLREAFDLSARVLDAEHDKMIGAIGRVFLAGARELLAGVIAELEAERPTNAIRLARHLFEFELEFFYLTDRPAVRIQQWFAQSARRGLTIEERVSGVRFSREAKGQMNAHIARAKNAAEERQGKPDTPEGWGLPPLAVMQEVAEDSQPHRAENYDLFYRHSSSLSHPGPLSGATYVQNVGGALRVRADGADPVRAGQAAALAALAFINLLDSVNWINSAKMGAEIRDLYGRIEKLVPKRRRRTRRAGR